MIGKKFSSSNVYNSSNLIYAKLINVKYPISIHLGLYLLMDIEDIRGYFDNGKFVFNLA